MLLLMQIRDNREAIDRIVEALMEKETLTGDEFRAMLAQYTAIPEENMEVVRAQAKRQPAMAFQPPSEHL